MRHTQSITERVGRARAWFARYGLLVIGAVALVVVGAIGGGSSQAACSGCHAMRPFSTALKAGPHATVNCYRCHLQSGAWSFPGFKSRELLRMYPAALAGDGLSGPTTEISRRACLGCHTAILDDLTQAAGLRIKHAVCAPGPSCDLCHSTAAHGTAVRWPREPLMEDCVLCHRDLGAPVECDTCHAGKSERDRLTKGPWQVTHGPTWKETHGMGSLQYCATCHPDDYCVKCHNVVLPHTEGFGRTHGEQAMQPNARCLDCHDRVALCDECHGIPMPHPATFLPQHSKEATSAESPACTAMCHKPSDCVDCHVKHTHPGNTAGTLGDSETGAIAIPGGAGR